MKGGRGEEVGLLGGVGPSALETHIYRIPNSFLVSLLSRHNKDSGCPSTPFNADVCLTEGPETMEPASWTVISQSMTQRNLSPF